MDGMPLLDPPTWRRTQPARPRCSLLECRPSGLLGQLPCNTGTCIIPPRGYFPARPTILILQQTLGENGTDHSLSPVSVGDITSHGTDVSTRRQVQNQLPLSDYVVATLIHDQWYTNVTAYDLTLSHLRQKHLVKGHTLKITARHTGTAEEVTLYNLYQHTSSHSEQQQKL